MNEAAKVPEISAPEFSMRQCEVLAVVLDLMVEAGDSFSLAKVCRKASCSKETLYNWFGDRDGLLTATVRWQAGKVRMPTLSGRSPSAREFRATLTAFAQDWLSVISGDFSAALNRLAISHAGSGKSRLGEIVLNNGPLAMIARLKPIFEIGAATGLLAIDDMAQALRAFFGLVIADWQIRKLLGDKVKPTALGIEKAAERAVEQFIRLYGREVMNP